MTTDAVRGTRIRAARQAAGLTQAELARQVGLSRGQMNKLERGKARGAYATFARLCTALGLPAQETWIVVPPVLAVAR